MAQVAGYVPSLGKPLRRNAYAKVWRAARDLALTPAQVASPLARRPYDLRHAAVSAWLNAGVPATKVGAWAWHSVQVLLRICAKCIMVSVVDTGGVLLNGDVLLPARERRQAMVWAVLEMLGLAVMVYGPTAVAVAISRPAVWVLVLGAMGGVVITYVPILAADCLGPSVRVTEQYGDYLTGKTITGWRSVDLSQIATVRFRRTTALGHSPDHIMVTDTSGAILVVQTNDPYALEAIRDALPRSFGRPIRISPTAAVILGLEPQYGHELTPCRDRGTLLRGVGLGLLHFFLYIATLSAVFDTMAVTVH